MLLRPLDVIWGKFRLGKCMDGRWLLVVGEPYGDVIPVMPISKDWDLFDETDHLRLNAESSDYPSTGIPFPSFVIGPAIMDIRQVEGIKIKGSLQGEIGRQFLEWFPLS